MMERYPDTLPTRLNGERTYACFDSEGKFVHVFDLPLVHDVELTREFAKRQELIMIEVEGETLERPRHINSWAEVRLVDVADQLRMESARDETRREHSADFSLDGLSRELLQESGADGWGKTEKAFRPDHG